MRWLLALTLIIPYTILTVGIIILAPFARLFTPETVRQTFISTQIYDRIVVIAQTQWITYLPTQSKTDDLFTQTITNHIGDILTKSWVESNLNQLVDQSFETLNTGTYTPLHLEFTELKRNYLAVLKSTPVGPTIPHWEEQVPTTIPLAQLFKVPDDTLAKGLLQIKLIRDRIPVILAIFGVLMVLLLLVLYYVLPFKLAWLWHAWTLVGLGVLVLGLVAVVPVYLRSLQAAPLGSGWRELLWLLVTALAETILRWWLVSGLGSFGLGLLALLGWWMTYRRKQPKNQEIME